MELHSQVIWDLIKKEVLSYAISDDIESLNLNSNQVLVHTLIG
jgi:hypothetical protein